MFMFPIQFNIPCSLSFVPTQSAKSPDPKVLSPYKLVPHLDLDYQTLRIPKRLSGKVFQLVGSLIVNNEKCHYAALLSRVCPNKHERASVEISQRWKEKMINDLYMSQDTSTNLNINTEDTNLPVIPDRGDEMAPESLEKSISASQWDEIKRLDLSTPYSQVYEFCKIVISRVIPKDLIGSDLNWNKLFKCVYEFIKLRRYEDLRLAYIVDGMSIPDIWKSKAQSSSGTTHFFKCKELQLELVYWLFNHFLTSVLRSHFYATETSGGGNKVVYYRHDVWRELTGPAFEEFSSQSLDPLPKRRVRELVSSNRLGPPSEFRFVPKMDGGYRGIMCLGRTRIVNEFNPDLQTTRNAVIPSVNQYLKSTFAALSFEHWKRKKSAIGGAIASLNQLQTKLVEFKKRLMNENLRKIPKLYFVKVDIKKCYDTIPAEKAYELASVLLKDEYKESFQEYFFHRMQTVTCRAGSKNVKVAYKTQTEYLSSSKTGLDLAKSVTGKTSIPSASLGLHASTKVVIDQATGTTGKGEELCDLLYQHLFHNLVRHHGSCVYQQKVGVPQGSVLSTLLCNIVYARLEQDLFADFPLNDHENVSPYLFTRFVDDFLFVCPDRTLADQFLARMTRGFPDYGAFIHTSKTLTNFTPSPRLPHLVQMLRTENPTNGVPSRYMPYIGVWIDTQTLELRRPQFNHHNHRIPGPTDMFTIRSHSLRHLQHSVLRHFQSKFCAALSSTRLNTPTTVASNAGALAAETLRRAVAAGILRVGKSRVSCRLLSRLVDTVLVTAVRMARRVNGARWHREWETLICESVIDALKKEFEK